MASLICVQGTSQACNTAHANSVTSGWWPHPAAMTAACESDWLSFATLMPARIDVLRRLVASHSGNLVLMDANNATLWSSQTACLGTTPAGGNFSICLQDPHGAVLLQHSSGAPVWTSAQQAACSGVPARFQLSSPGASNAACIIGTQELRSRDCSLKLTASSPAGKLHLVTTATNGASIWAAPGAASSGAQLAPYGVCLHGNGSLVHSVRGGATVLWSSPAAGAGSTTAAKGPFTALLRDGSFQVRSC
jgi:hypothetical protein